jgi:hypothetical protein
MLYEGWLRRLGGNLAGRSGRELILLRKARSDDHSLVGGLLIGAGAAGVGLIKVFREL